MSLAITASALGKTLSSAMIESGLRELNPDLHFDMPNKLGDASFTCQTVDFDVINENRQGIYWNGRYVTGMDRGMVTEYKLWEEEDGIEEIPASDKERYGDGCCTYVEILPSDSFYNEALLRAEKKDDNFTMDEDGKVFKWAYFRFTKVKGRIIRVGWRHTLENLIGVNIPGLTRRAIEEKFSVDLSLRPYGPDADAVFTEE